MIWSGERHSVWRACWRDVHACTHRRSSKYIEQR